MTKRWSHPTRYKKTYMGCPRDDLTLQDLNKPYIRCPRGGLTHKI